MGYCGEQLTEEDLISKLSIDCEIPAADITPSTVHDVSYLEPYGMGNPAPVFLCRELILSEITPMSGDKHLRLALMGGGQRLSCFMFGSRSADMPFSVGERIDICCTLDLSTYRGVQSVQVVIKDIRKLSPSAIRLTRTCPLRRPPAKMRLSAPQRRSSPILFVCISCCSRVFQAPHGDGPPACHH